LSLSKPIEPVEIPQHERHVRLARALTLTVIRCHGTLIT